MGRFVRVTALCWAVEVVVAKGSFPSFAMILIGRELKSVVNSGHGEGGSLLDGFTSALVRMGFDQWLHRSMDFPTNISIGPTCQLA